MATSISAILKREFSSLTPYVYFDTAGKSIQPKSVTAIGYQTVTSKETPWVGLRGTYDDTQKLRFLFSTLIDTEPENIALMPSTSFAMTLAARNIVRLGLLRKDELVLVLEKEMGSVIYPWQTVCQDTGASLLVVPFQQPHDYTWTTQILEAIDVSEQNGQDISVVAIPQVHWCDGSYINFDVLNQRLNQYAATHQYRGTDKVGRRPLLVVDGTQSIGALPFSVSRIRPDFVACSVHKWLLSPYGMSLVYINPKHQSLWLPLDLHERGRMDSDLAVWDEVIFFNDSSGYPSSFFDDSRKFDSGGRANPVLVPMVIRGLEIVLEISPERVMVHSKILAETLISQLSSIKDFIFIPREIQAGHIIGLSLTSRAMDLGINIADISHYLKENDVHVSVRGGRMRISLYIYNSFADIFKFSSMLIQIVHQMKVTLSPLSVNRRSILITGANGWMAQFVFQKLLSTAEVQIEDSQITQIFCTYSNPNRVPHWVIKENRMLMDFSAHPSENHSVAMVIQNLKPDIVIHLAAVSSPAICHADPEAAMRVNCPSNLLDEIKHYVPGCLFIFASTDMVYDGEHAPYQIHDFHGNLQFNPSNVYGLSKRLFEKEVLTLPNSYCLRLSNMVGKPFVYQPAGEKFLQFLWNSFRSRKDIGLKADEKRSFVHIEDVNTVILRLVQAYLSNSIDTTCDRVLNVGGPQGLSRLELAGILAKSQKIHFVVTTSSDVPTGQDSDQCVGEDAWKVHILDKPDQINNIDELKNPKDITMDVLKTSLYLKISFSMISDIISSCLENDQTF